MINLPLQRDNHVGTATTKIEECVACPFTVTTPQIFWSCSIKIVS